MTHSFPPRLDLCFSRKCSRNFSHWPLLKVVNSLDGNSLHFDVPLKHAIELGVISVMRVFASCIDQAGPFMEKYNFLAYILSGSQNFFYQWIK